MASLWANKPQECVEALMRLMVDYSSTCKQLEWVGGCIHCVTGTTTCTWYTSNVGIYYCDCMCIIVIKLCIQCRVNIIDTCGIKYKNKNK